MTEEEIEFDPSVLTENNQYKALYLYLKDRQSIINEVKTLRKYTRLTPAVNFNLEYIAKMLHNSWNTESLIKQNLGMFSDDLKIPLQWILPQTYYSICLNLCALYSVLPSYNSLGENPTHAKIIKIFSELIEHDFLPKKISFYCNGIRKNLNLVDICNPQISDFVSSSSFLDTDIDTVNRQICSLLSRTRKIEIESRKDNAISEENNIRKRTNEEIKKIKTQKIKTQEEQLYLNQNKIKKPIKILLEDIENKISDNIKKTTILNYLYRKRIKSNYSAIDNYLHEKIDASNIINSCINMLEIINTISEIYIYKLIGKDNFKSLMNGNFPKIRERLNSYLDLN